MTPEEERKQLREVFLLRDTVKRLEEDCWELAKRLRRAEQRIFSLANWLCFCGGTAAQAVLFYAAFHRENSWWDWVLIAFLAISAFSVAQEAISSFFKN